MLAGVILVEFALLFRTILLVLSLHLRAHQSGAAGDQVAGKGSGYGSALAHLGAGGLTQRSDCIDRADPQGQKGVGGELGEL